MGTTLSESDSKALLEPFGIPFLPEELVDSTEAAAEVAARFDGPLALKLCGRNIAHKSERGLVRLGIEGVDAAVTACRELLDAATPQDEATGVLIAPMARGLREFIVGTAMDPVFGHTVVFGVGGVLAEAIADVTVRLAPLRRHDAVDMLHSLRSQALLGPFRGESEVAIEAFADLLCALSEATSSIDGLLSIDLNPVMVVDGLPIALDALVEVSDAGVLA